MQLVVTEDHLTFQSFASIIAALSSLYTKCWLVQQNRLADLDKYAQTADEHFDRDAHLVIEELTYNFLGEIQIDINMSTSPLGIVEGVKMACDGLARFRRERLGSGAEMVEYAREIAGKIVDLLYPENQKTKREGIIRSLLPHILRLGGSDTSP